MSIIKFESNQTTTMTSLELLEIINSVREEFNESRVENSHFLRRIEDELDGEMGDTKTFRHPQNKVEMRYYTLTLEQCTLVGMRESKGVRRAVLAKLKELESNQVSTPKLPTNYLEALKALVVSEEQNIKLLEENKQKDEKILALKEENEYNIALIDEYEDTLPDEYEHTATAVGKILGVKPNLFMKLLSELGYIYKIRTDTNRVWTGKAYYQERGWFSNPKQLCQDGVRRTAFRITNKGVKELTRHIVKGKIDISGIRID